ERVVEDEPDTAGGAGHELHVGQFTFVAHVGEHEFGGAPGALPDDLFFRHEVVGVVDPQLAPQLFSDPDAARAGGVLFADRVEVRFDVQVGQLQPEDGVFVAFVAQFAEFGLEFAQSGDGERAGRDGAGA